MSDLTLSVVVPCRNRARYLRATLDSILDQAPAGAGPGPSSIPEVECIVIDAQSTDGTLDILRGYGRRIRWVSEPDAGHADAINKGWRMARGEVLAWLNADDVYAPGGPGEALAYLAAHPEVDVVYGDCGAIDDDPEQVRPFGYSYLRPWNLDYAVLHCDNCIPQPSAFIRRRILDRVGLLDTRFHQKKDHELWLRIAAGGGVIRHVPRLWAYARAIRGLSFDGRTAAPACVQLARHYFDRLEKGGRPRWDRVRRRAMSNAYVRGMDYAWAGGQLRGLCGRYAAAALTWDPANWRAILPRLRRMMAWSGGKTDPPPSDEVELAWLLGQLQPGPGEALVLEPRDTVLGLALASRGWRTLVVASCHEPWTYHHPRLRLLRDHPETLDLPDGCFDLVVARDCADPSALLSRLKPGGQVLYTGPRGGTIAWRPGPDRRWIPCDAGRGLRFGGSLVRESQP